MTQYNHKKIEGKWQKEWEKKKLYKTPDEKKGAENYYALVEFPYPSGNLHTGHWYAFAVPDILARKKRMEGKNVLFPIGFDAFGLPAENAAIKRGINPKKWTYENIDYMKKQLRSMGASFDWSREVITADPEYYKWTQWIFLQFFKKGLAYRAETAVNWCPKDKTVLANEQVVAGKCERCGAEVEQRQMRQWMLRITDYAERLLSGLDKLNWKEEIKEAQRNWIGKSEGAEIEFKINPPPAPSQREGDEIPPFIQSEKDKNLEKILLNLLDISIKNGKRLIVSGGWAVDIYAGRRIRNHDDIDCNVLHKEADWWKAQLQQIGFSQIPPGDPKKDPKYHINMIKNIKGEDYKIDFIAIGFDENKNIYDMEWGKPDQWGFGQDDIISKTFDGQIAEIFSAPVQLWLKCFDRDKDKIDRIVLTHPFTPSLSEGKFRYHTTDPQTWRALQERALEMRAHPTEAEKIMWQSLRKNLAGSHFRRQHIIGRFVVDFVCLEKSLVVEVDGDIHDYQKIEDEERTELLKSYGFKVIRFRNKEVLEDVKAVVEKIKNELKTLPFGEGAGGVIKVFTTRPDTLFGATYMVLAPEHLLISNLQFSISNYTEVKDYIEKAKKKTPLERQQEAKQKTGIELKGIKAVNPATKEEIPVWTADYVLGGYGTGAIMAVPAHDERDFEFAKKFGLPIKKVIKFVLRHIIRNAEEIAAGYKSSVDVEGDFWGGPGELINSGQFSGMDSEKAKKEITEFVGGKIKTQYKLRDWVVSRQRYWGVPIPIIHCGKCALREPSGQGVQVVPEKDLPVLLPEIKDYLPTGEGKSPLAKAEKWLNVKCPKCGEKALRETDTLDTFVDSSWYFLRYCDPKNKKTFADAKKMSAWMPVSLYSGGAEHTTMHLLYSRFWYKAMFDLGLLGVPDAKLGDEPYKERRNRGIILGPDGQKMSKSKGNVIDPDEYVAKFGSDTVRMYLAFIGPYSEAGSYPWDPHGILGIRRFLDRVWNMRVLEKPGAETLARALNKTIKQVSENIEDFKFNTAISAMMILLNEFEKEITHLPTPSLILSEGEKKESIFSVFIKLLAPFAPHLTEEIWNKLGNKKSIHLEPWPKFDPKMLEEDNFDLVVQINGKTRDKFSVPINISQGEAEQLTLSREKVKAALENKKLRKTIFVPKRLINFVT